MKMKVKIFSLIMALLMCVAVFVACDSPKASDDDDEKGGGKKNNGSGAKDNIKYSE